ncbi:MAG: ABC transporter permease, partial [Pedosphaera sp.]|nr:ABC transporter permease [Pedosphaera sp.]
MMRALYPADAMRQITIIAINAFMELVRQPVFLLLFTLSPMLCVGLALFDYFGFGGTSTGPVNFDIKMVKDGALTVTFFTGIAAAVLCATSSISREIETGTALAVLSKPVGRLHFLLGKYLGIIGALSVGAYLNLIGVLLASRMAHDAYANFDIVGTITFLIFISLAYLAGGLVNYFLHKPFVPITVGYLTIALTVGFFVICAQDKTTAFYWVDSGAGIDATFWEIWKFTDTGGTRGDEVLQKLEIDINMWEYLDFGLIQLTLLILFALWILAAVAVACSTRLSWMPTMMICTGVFLIGMMSDYLLGESAEGGGL